jgi:hypothetical protein
MVIKREQKRATYEDTLNRQEELRKKLDQLIQENRCIKDDKEREKMFHLFGDCFLGEDGNKKIPYFIQYPTGIIINVDDFGQTIRLLCYEKQNTIPITFFSYKGNQTTTIQEVWKAIRNIAFSLFPIAQNKAVTISKEQTHMGPSEAGKV